MHHITAEGRAEGRTPLRARQVKRVGRSARIILRRRYDGGKEEEREEGGKLPRCAAL